MSQFEIINSSDVKIRENGKNSTHADELNNLKTTVAEMNTNLNRLLNKFDIAKPNESASLYNSQVGHQIREYVGTKSSLNRHKNLSLSAIFNSNSNGLTMRAYQNGNKSDELPDRIYVKRNSLLTDMFAIKDIRTIRHIFVSIMIVLALQVLFNDIMVKGRIDLNFDLIRWSFDNFSVVFYTWLYMSLFTIVFVYYCFHYWSNTRAQYLTATTKGNSKLNTYDLIWLAGFIAYQCIFLYLPASIVVKHRIPPASSFIILMEQLRMLMKSYAFVRSNVPRALKNSQAQFEGAESKSIKHGQADAYTKYKSSPTVTETSSLNEKKNVGDDDNDNALEEDNDLKLCPNFSDYLYFLFAPTLVYRDSYPRTKRVDWYQVIINFAQVIGSILYTNYIFERFCIPVFQHFNTESVTINMFVHSILNCTLPGTLLLLVAFFAFLHCWLNAFAEMLRFADRMFYQDWWNSTNYSNYYRTWNVVVHDWLYTYIYKDVYQILGKNQKMTSQLVIFVVSALFHEYVLTLAFGFFYPVLFLMFGAIGFLCIFLRSAKNPDFWNFLLWLGLCIGLGGLMCLYSIEWYARLNCPKSFDSDIVDYLLPRSFTCGMGKSMSTNVLQRQLNQSKVEL